MNCTTKEFSSPFHPSPPSSVQVAIINTHHGPALDPFSHGAVFARLQAEEVKLHLLGVAAHITGPTACWFFIAEEGGYAPVTTPPTEKGCSSQHLTQQGLLFFSTLVLTVVALFLFSLSHQILSSS